MRLSAPRNVVFIISVCLIILGLLASLVFIPFFSGISNWVSFVGGILLVLGCMLSGI
jgi:phosphotransferase system  glucose/maltose/N-acetylglucosamine-specific IIC component